MEVAEAAIIRFDDDVSDESKHRIVDAIVGMNPPRTEVADVRLPGAMPCLFVAHEETVQQLRAEVCDYVSKLWNMRGALHA